MSLDNDLARRILAELADIKARLPAVGEPNRSLSRRAAAEYLGLHEKTLAELTTTAEEPGRVTGYKTGSRWKYRLADLDRYRDQLTAKTPYGRRSSIDWSR